MRIQRVLLLAIISISLYGCNTVGNVVPQNGPTMEQVYDSLEKTTASKIAEANAADSDMQVVRKAVTPVFFQASHLFAQIPSSATTREFKKLPNPELRLYVFPHLAGSDQVPVPGYTTVFSASNQDHYALSSENVP